MTTATKTKPKIAKPAKFKLFTLLASKKGKEQPVLEATFKTRDEAVKAWANHPEFPDNDLLHIWVEYKGEILFSHSKQKASLLKATHLCSERSRLEAEKAYKARETKTTKTESGDSVKLPKAAKEKKPAAGVDKYKCRLGSQAAVINAAVTDEPQSLETIAKACKLPTGRIKGHLKAMAAKGFVTLDLLGYRDAKSDAKPSGKASKASRSKKDQTPKKASEKPISTRLPPVKVVYDGKGGKRAFKVFQDAHEGKRFYAKQLKAGLNPQVKKVN